MNREKFFNSLRSNLYKGGLSQSAVDALDGILNEVEGMNLPAAHVAYIMATAYHETGKDLKPKSENLNYTTASRIKAVWPTRFANAAAAQPYVRNPQKLANLVYGGRLGNTGANDGWTYRGRGHIQTTGKVNYQKVSKYIGLDAVKNPELLMEIRYSVIALVHGMVDGIYTGKKLANYKLPSDYYNARSIVNADKGRTEGGMKIGDRIAGYASSFEAALAAAGYKPTSSKTQPRPTPAEAPTPSSKPEDITLPVSGNSNWLIELFKWLASKLGG